MQVINRTPFGKTAPLRKAQQNAHERIISIADQVRMISASTAMIWSPRQITGLISSSAI